MQLVSDSIFKHVGSFLVSLLPNFAWMSVMAVYAAYYDLQVTGGSPTWQNVAAGSMAIAGVLGGLAFRMFMSKMNAMQKALVQDRERRDQQHKANVSAIVALSMSTMDRVSPEEKQHIREMINQLLSDKGED
jgi:hypothetical protein